MQLKATVCFCSFKLQAALHQLVSPLCSLPQAMQASGVVHQLYIYVFQQLMLTWSCRRENHITYYMSSFAGKDVCNSYSYGVRAVIQCLPAWFRFIQCLRRYRDTKRAFPHLVNAGKYSTSFFVVTFAALYKTHKGTQHVFPCKSKIFWSPVWLFHFLIVKFHKYNRSNLRL